MLAAKTRYFLGRASSKVELGLRFSTRGFPHGKREVLRDYVPILFRRLPTVPPFLDFRQENKAL